MKRNMKRFFLILIVILIAAVWQNFGISQRAPLFLAIENGISDAVYRRPLGSSQNIVIIGVDEDTLAAYGKFEDWSREKLAQLVEVLSAEQDKAPAVIGMDFLLTGESESNPESDARLVTAVKMAGNVIFATRLEYQTSIGQNADGSFYADEWNIKRIEKPFAALAAVSRQGYANTLVDSDGFVRRSRLTVMAEDEVQKSLAYQVYNVYQEALGKNTREYDSIVQFQYSGTPGTYEKVSLVDVLEGKRDLRIFRNAIVLVGAYALGMQDSYHVAVDHGEQMYGVEIHANIIESLLDGKIVKDVPKIWATVAISFVLAGYAFVAQRHRKLLPIVLEGVAVMMFWLIAGIILKNFSWILPLSVVELGILLLMIYFVITKYVVEKVEKKRVIKAFERYVAPEIVKELGKDESFESRLGGERRDIAVLFVDIRGFTTMSESLQPEQVVDILNEYLELTSRSIFNNQGTLDKFIGDATMAVFNAPVDLDDYVFKAVCAAYDMRKGAEALEKKLTEQFGNSVQFGIGVNCGPAIVGNIGSVKRMDYTAIGDTVNTAARLESNAKRGEILISEAVYERIKDRIEAEPVGELSLKGKATKILTYRLVDIK
ncbi:MAG: adenylate/guanylate cyclase domain-containing protein [Lachnospiraceae bacterium]|nr:adenylate/guanylate cyclase domain-containing protein [Lachnospiraceae bacterium]